MGSSRLFRALFSLNWWFKFITNYKSFDSADNDDEAIRANFWGRRTYQDASIDWQVRKTFYSQKLCTKLLKMLLYINDQDVFAAYRASERPENVRSLLRAHPELILAEPSKLGHRRSGYSYYRFCFVIYMMFKWMLMFWVQWKVFAHDEADATTPIYIYARRDTIWHRISDLMGNAFLGSVDLGVSYYFWPPGVVIYSTFFFARDPKRPCDARFLRFLIDPEREIRRVDLMLKDRIDECQESIKNSFQNLIRIQKQRRQAVTFDEMRSIIMSFDASSKHLHQLRNEALWCLRPIAYTLAWYESVNRIGVVVAWLVIGLTTFYATATIYIFIYFLDYRCVVSTTPDDCVPAFQFSSLQDMYFLLDSIILVSFAVFFLGYLYMKSLFIFVQFTAVNRDIREQILNCIKATRSFQLMAKNHCQRSADYLAQSKLLFDQYLLRVYLRVTEDEAELTALMSYFNEHISTPMLFLVAVPFLLNVLSQNILVQETAGFRRMTLGGLWCLINTIILISSRMYVDNQNLTVHYYTFLKELALLRDMELGFAHYGEVPSTFWHKLVYSSRSSVNRFRLCLLSFRCTYSQVVEVNILLSSIYFYCFTPQNAVITRRII